MALVFQQHIVAYQNKIVMEPTLDALLAPGGPVGLLAITMPHDRMLATRRTHTWINKYVFPGGFLPSVEVIDQVDSTSSELLRRASRRDIHGDYFRRQRRECADERRV